MITFKQFLVELTDFELMLTLFLKAEVGMRDKEQIEEAIEWWRGNLDFFDISTNADTAMLKYLERNGVDIDENFDFVDDANNAVPRLRTTMIAYRNAWLKKNEDTK